MTHEPPDTKSIPAIAQPLPVSYSASLANLVRLTPARNLWIAFSILAAGLIFTLFVTLYSKANAETAAQRDFDFAAAEIQLIISDRLDRSALLLRSGAALFDASPAVTRQEWKTFAQHLQIEQQLPGIQGIGFALIIPPGQLAKHIQEIRAQGFPNYSVTPPGDRENYTAIVYLEPFLNRNLRAFGYDMFSDPVRRAAMERARDKNTVALSEKVTLVQETNQDVQPGTLMYVPVYLRGLPTETVEQRRTAIQGWVYSPYRMTDMMLGTLKGWDQPKQVALQVYDGSSLSPGSLLFDSQAATNQPPASDTSLTTTKLIDFGGQHWTLRFTSLGGMAAMANSIIIWATFIGGASSSLILFWLTLSMLSIRANSKRMAEQLTAELRQSELKYRTVADFTYDWEAWRGPDGSYRYVSPSCLRISGRTPSEFMADPDLLVQITHPEDQPSLKAHLLDTLCEPSEKDLEINFRIITPDGQTRWISHWCTPVFTEAGQLLGRRESNRDDTIRNQAEEKVRLLNLELAQLAQTDSLTGINNRRSLFELAEREFDISTRYNSPLSLLIYDIDDFKKINDTCGHITGDHVLKSVTQSIRAELRSTDIIGRFGGDEFVIILPQTSADEALAFAERICASTAALNIETEQGPLKLTISIGIAQSHHSAPTLPGQSDTFENLFLRADQALYAAKHAGKNCTRCAPEDGTFQPSQTGKN